MLLQPPAAWLREGASLDAACHAQMERPADDLTHLIWSPLSVYHCLSIWQCADMAEGAEQPGLSNARVRAERGRFEQALAEAEFLERVADLLADRVVERLAPYLKVGDAPPEGLVDASEVARMAGRTRRWVYEHAGVLGAVPLGSGARPRLGFHPARVRDYLSRDVGTPEPRPAPQYATPRRQKPRALSQTARELAGEAPLDLP